MSTPTRPARDTLTFVGTATLLLSYGPFTLLTDPNFLHRGQRAWVGRGLWTRRLTEPALAVEELPPLDAVVLSHLHGDHWDRVARRGLPRHLPVVTTPHAARRLQGIWGFRRAAGLRTWESWSTYRDGWTLTVTAVPGHHGPGPAQRLLLPPVMGSVLELTRPDGGLAHRLYLSGDTLYDDRLAEVAGRWPELDLAVLHLGGTTLPGGLLVTMDGRQGADLLELLRPATAVPVHLDDYPLFRSPLSAFSAEVERRGLADRVCYVERGGSLPLELRPAP